MRPQRPLPVKVPRVPEQAPGQAPGPAPRQVRVEAPAKVNLHLGVGALRADGYHELVNLFQAVNLTDQLTAQVAEQTSLTHTGAGAGKVPLDKTNLAWRAAEALAAELGRTAGAAGPASAAGSGSTAVALHIDKQIPVAGGMAGGSADAAAALLACARLWGLPDTPEAAALLARVGAGLGADVPFALLGGTALGLGIGEKLRPVPCAAMLHWVFATQDFGISAGAAYRELDKLRATGQAGEPAGAVQPLLDALASGEAARIGPLLANDLSAACFSLAPVLRDTIEAGLAAGALGAVVSGSGPSCAFLAASAQAAGELAQALASAGVCHGARTATGPAPGARLAG